MNKLDDLAWKREFDRVEARQEKRYVKFDEYMASLDIERQKNINTRSAIAKRRIESERSKKLEKQRKKAEFWRRVMSYITRLTIAAIAIFLLINFTGINNVI